MRNVTLCLVTVNFNFEDSMMHGSVSNLEDFLTVCLHHLFDILISSFLTSFITARHYDSKYVWSVMSSFQYCIALSLYMYNSININIHVVENNWTYCVSNELYLMVLVSFNANSLRKMLSSLFCLHLLEKPLEIEKLKLIKISYPFLLWEKMTTIKWIKNYWKSFTYNDWYYKLLIILKKFFLSFWSYSPIISSIISFLFRCIIGRIKKVLA